MDCPGYTLATVRLMISAPNPLPRPARPTSRQAGRRAYRPNILLVVVDDLGWGEVGAYGQKVLQTPNLDRLAAGGLRFDQAYATPTCAPTRCSLFTGLHTGHARV